MFGTGQRKDQDELESWLGIDDARKMWQIAGDANQLVRDRITEFKIACDLKNGELTLAHRERHEGPLWDYAEHLEKNYGYIAKRAVSRDEAAEMLGVDTLFGGYLDTCAGHIHPLTMAWFNRNIPSSSRATVISLHSQSDALGQMAGGPGVGLIGRDLGVRVALSVAGLLLLPALWLYGRAIRNASHLDS